MHRRRESKAPELTVFAPAVSRNALGLPIPHVAAAMVEDDASCAHAVTEQPGPV